MCSNRFSNAEKLFSKLRRYLISADTASRRTVRKRSRSKTAFAYTVCGLTVCLVKFSEAGCAVAGALCGFMLDYESGRLFGSSAFSLALFCAAVSALFSYLLKKNLPNAFGVNFVICLLYFSADYFFCFRIWPNESSSAVLLGETLPCAFWTISLSPAVFLAVKRILSPSDRLSEERRAYMNKKRVSEFIRVSFLFLALVSAAAFAAVRLMKIQL